MNPELAANILAKGKRLAPDRFPAPGPEIAKEWAAALAVVNLPPQLWADAVILWATTLVSDRMATPRDLVHAAYLTRDRWEQHPDTRAILDDYRAATLEANYARMGLAEPRPEDWERTHDGPQIHMVRRRQEGA